MRRVAIVGTSGSGKSTLREALVARLGVPGLELDAIQHQPGWHPIDPEAFRSQVADFLARHDAWVVDGNYSQVRDLVLAAADTVVWLDLARWRVTWRVVRRSVVRLVRRQELWNGNRESARALLSWDPERSIIRWAWSTHGRRRVEYGQLLAPDRAPGLTVHRLRTPREVRAFLGRGG